MFKNLFSITEEEKGLRTYKVFNFLGIKIKKRIENRFDILDKEKYERELTLEEQKYYIGSIFKHRLGYECDFDNPKSFNEKMQWLKLYYRNPLMTTCADKVAVRDYIKEKLGEEYLIPCLGVYNSPDDIDFDSLPEQFVIKVNWGCGQNIIVKDKSKLDIDDAKQKLNEWMKPKNNWYYQCLEWCYKDIESKIIVEKFINKLDETIDYKFLCYNGQPKNMFFVHNREKGKEFMTVTFFDMTFKKLPFSRLFNVSEEKIDKPLLWEEMMRISNLLSQEFPFVRVDFYVIDNQLKIGELTFYPGNGMEPFAPIEWDYKLGEMLKLPEKE